MMAINNAEHLRNQISKYSVLLKTAKRPDRVRIIIDSLCSDLENIEKTQQRRL